MNRAIFCETNLSADDADKCGAAEPQPNRHSILPEAAEDAE
jgi:hypothetical protein